MWSAPAVNHRAICSDVDDEQATNKAAAAAATDAGADDSECKLLLVDDVRQFR